mmetsp:Transcript_1428/g.5256  ORF Transcript_1428/g.5256 Transcript_1428/m.5256 type:complete len:274 (-) Transcript_1428:2906-3727(-)
MRVLKCLSGQIKDCQRTFIVLTRCTGACRQNGRLKDWADAGELASDVECLLGSGSLRWAAVPHCHTLLDTLTGTRDCLRSGCDLVLSGASAVAQAAAVEDLAGCHVEESIVHVYGNAIYGEDVHHLGKIAPEPALRLALELLNVPAEAIVSTSPRLSSVSQHNIAPGGKRRLEFQLAERSRGVTSREEHEAGVALLHSLTHRSLVDGGCVHVHPQPRRLPGPGCRPEKPALTLQTRAKAVRQHTTPARLVMRHHDACRSAPQPHVGPREEGVA